LKVTDHSEELDINGKMWTGFMWLRKGISGGFFEYGNKLSGFHKWWEIY
jgi:hypothetical protein